MVLKNVTIFSERVVDCSAKALTNFYATNYFVHSSIFLLEKKRGSPFVHIHPSTINEKRSFPNEKKISSGKILNITFLLPITYSNVLKINFLNEKFNMYRVHQNSDTLSNPISEIHWNFGKRQNKF